MSRVLLCGWNPHLSSLRRLCLFIHQKRQVATRLELPYAREEGSGLIQGRDFGFLTRFESRDEDGRLLPGREVAICPAGGVKL